MISAQEREYLRTLAARQRELAESDRNRELEKRWTAHNALQKGEPLAVIETETFWNEICPPLRCTDPDARAIEERILFHLVPAQTPFTYESITPSSHFWLHFLSRQLRTLPAFQSHQKLSGKNLPNLQTTFRKLFREIRSARTISDDIRVRNAIFELISPFLESALQELPLAAPEKGSFSEVLEYIDRNLNTEINVVVPAVCRRSSIFPFGAFPVRSIFSGGQSFPSRRLPNSAGMKISIFSIGFLRSIPELLQVSTAGTEMQTELYLHGFVCESKDGTLLRERGKEKPFEERFFPSRTLLFPNLFK